MKLTYLALGWCVLFPHEVNEQAKKTIIGLHQKCIDSKAVKVLYEEDWCGQCKFIYEHGDLMLLSNFTSLVHLYASAQSHPTAMKDILSSCKMLKYFVNASIKFESSTLPLVLNCNLEQLSMYGRSGVI